MKVKLPMLAMACLLLSACTGLSANRYLGNKHLFMVGRGDPTAYADGYVDGCAVGRRLAGDKRFSYRQDRPRFEKDALYARGWQEGQINCRNEVLAQGFAIAPKKDQPSRPSHPNVQQDVPLSAKHAEHHAVEAEMREIWDELKK